MEKSMRDLDKIRENYEFQLESRQVKLLVLTVSAIGLLIFVLGFLVGRHFPHAAASREYASAVTTPRNGPGPDIAGEASTPGFKFEFFEELSQDDSGAETQGAKPQSPEEGITRPGDPAAEPSQAISSNRSRQEAEDSNEKSVPEGSGAATAPAPRTIPSQYTIQVGAFEGPEGAEELSDGLKQKNYPSYTRVKTVPGKGTWHRVRVGRYSSRAEAERIAKLLEEREGLATFITLYARN